MRYISGGYYIISPSPRPEGLDEALLPPTLLSLSQYFCEFHPDLAFMSQNISDARKRRYARELGLQEIDYMAIEKWVEGMYAKGLFTYPQVFLTLATAREFCTQFLLHVPEPRLIGIGLPEELVQDFFNWEGTLAKPEKEQYGFEKLLINEIEVEETGAALLGYEVLAFEYGAFTTYFYSPLERDYSERFDFKLNAHGFFGSFEEALHYSTYSNDKDDSGEYFWLPWAIFSYSR